ncbi:MAG: hypothetical protein WC709_07070 [Thermoleophilia bacterium]
MLSVGLLASVSAKASLRCTVGATTTTTTFAYEGPTLLKLAATQGTTTWRIGRSVQRRCSATRVGFASAAGEERLQEALFLGRDTSS